MRTALCTVVLASLVATPTRAGCCFLWKDDGSRSACKEAVPTGQECERFKSQGDWDRFYFIDVAAGERCACEDPEGKPGGDLPVMYHSDRDDLDDDDNRGETVRWRYVVSVGAAEVAGGRCRERHRLYSGWTDGEYSWGFARPVVTGYEKHGERSWWVDRCPSATCQRVYVGGSYKGSNRENYHYFWRCRAMGLGDLRIVRVRGNVQIASSIGASARWTDVVAGDVLGAGTYLRVGPDSEVHWQRDQPGGATGTIGAEDRERTFRIRATDLELIEPGSVGSNSPR